MVPSYPGSAAEAAGLFNPPTPGSGEWRGRETMSKTEPKGGNLLKSLKKEIRRGGAAVSQEYLGAPGGLPGASRSRSEADRFRDPWDPENQGFP